ncbi:MFS transporter [Novosphingobium sp. PC22D]|uniref:peptide MFS transporter n=1 Tax=Novosphingobium sp. PC22D TaxID=1962403 RepID=UPI000BEF211D|nr:peptide MFS transporter [Novosphingobium sp. PC22D]PEQ12297.1 MFS transporter [Novosphingobium sp. PC22D]
MKDIASWNEGDWIAAVGVAALLVFLAIGGYAVTRSKPEFAGHPKGLYILFFAEMWERFSYYGMRALLTLYLVKHWLYSDGSANLIYGSYTALVYITPVLGGWLADRFLGQRKAVMFGAVLLTIGHLCMAFEGDGSGYQNDPTLNVFWLALSFIIVGAGFLKANISVIVGQLYRRTDTRRDSAYTIFYIGINVGAAIGTIIAGYLGETLGWAYGFGAAGIGMLLGLIVFVVGKPLLLGRGEAPDPARLAAPVAGIKLEWLLYLLGVGGVAVIWVLIQLQSIVGWLMLLAGAALIVYVVKEALKLEPDARDRIFAAVFLILLQPVFWGLFEQAGGSINLFTDRFVDRQGVPASLFQSINPIYIILLGPIFGLLWPLLASRGLEPSTPAKMGLGIVQLGFAFVVLVWGANAAGPDALVPVVFIFLLYLFQTTGELCLSPVGLSAMNRLSPLHMASLIMAAWFFGTAGGNFVAGLIGSIMGEGEGGEITREAALHVYWTIGLVAMGIGAAVVVVSPLVKRLMHLDTLRDDDVGDDLLGQSEMGIENQEAGMRPAVRPQ